MYHIICMYSSSIVLEIIKDDFNQMFCKHDIRYKYNSFTILENISWLYKRICLNITINYGRSSTYDIEHVLDMTNTHRADPQSNPYLMSFRNTPMHLETIVHTPL